MLVVAVGMALTMLVSGHYVTASPAPERQAQGVPWDDVELRGKIDPLLLKQLVTTSESLQPVIVEMKAQANFESVAGAVTGASVVESLRSTADISQREVRVFLAAEEASGRASEVKPLWVINAVGVHAAPATIWQLATRSDVAFVRADRWRQWVTTALLPSPLPTGTRELPTSDLPPFGRLDLQRRMGHQQDSGGPGRGRRSTSPAQAWSWPTWIQAWIGCIRRSPATIAAASKVSASTPFSWFDATPMGALYPQDGNGHGTHTMGTIAGQGGIGVAPGARVDRCARFGFDRHRI